MTDHEIPWGMQIAVHYDKVHPPRRIDVAEAAARAVVALLASPQAAPGGAWHDAVEHWRNGRIRKLVRRARGRRWEEVQDSGKLCAQVAHAAQLAWQSPAMPDACRSAWAAQDYRVRVVFPSPEVWGAASRPVRVVDAGFTELDGPRETARARW